MNNRRAPRVKKRMTCALRCGGRRYSGLVLDISANGLFVQTSAAPEPGEPVELEVSLPARREPLHIHGKVARRRVVPPRLRAVAQGGVGIALVNAPEEYFEYVAEVFRALAPDEKPEVKPRRKTSLERRARQLALRRSLGPRMLRQAELGDEAEPVASKAAVAKPGADRRYRVRVKLGLRKQMLEVMAGSAEDARRRALAEAGDGWRVLRCEEGE